MSDTSLMYWGEKLGKTQPRVLRFAWSITGAKAISPLVAGMPVMTGFDAADFASQAAIDAFLGTSSEFLLAAFDSTALGTDAFACIVAMQNQAAKVLQAKLTINSGTGGSTVAANCVAASSAMTSSSLTAQVAVGANGNIAFRGVSTGLDSLTSGVITLDIHWVSK